MDKTKNNKLVYVFIALIAIFGRNVCPLLFGKEYKFVVFIIWFVIFACIKLLGTRKKVYRNLKEKIIWLGIVLTVHYCLYFLFGIFEGFQKNPISFSARALEESIAFVLGTRFFIETVRCKMVNKNNSLLDYILISIVFMLYKIDYNRILFNMDTPTHMLEYVGGFFIPTLTESLILTYLSLIGGIKLSYILVLAEGVLELFIPVAPKLNWFFLFAKEIIMCIILYMIMNNIEIQINREYTKRDIKKQNLMSFVPVVGIMTLLVCFVIGIFPHRPVAVMSNSMVPVFRRGDFIIVEKFDSNVNKPSEVKLGDIIQYQLDGKLIVHRVIEINVDYKGIYTFRTKGDNNNGEDARLVTVNQIDSIVRAKIPYIGYPSVWFNEIILKNPSIVVTE